MIFVFARVIGMVGVVCIRSRWSIWQIVSRRNRIACISRGARYVGSIRVEYRFARRWDDAFAHSSDRRDVSRARTSAVEKTSVYFDEYDVGGSGSRPRRSCFE